MFSASKFLRTASLAAVILFTTSSHALTAYSIEARDLESFAKNCQAEPSLEQMRSEIPAMLARLTVPTDVIDRLTQQTHFLGQALDYLKKPGEQKEFNILLDGLPLANVDRPNLYAVALLTGLETVTGTRVDVEKIDFGGRDWLITKRFCLSDACRKHGRTRGPALFEFNGGVGCPDALCASERIFGAEKGLRILWSLLKYGAVMGRFTETGAGDNELSLDTIRALMIAFRAVPEHLRSVAIYGAHFYHYRKGETLPMYRGRKVFANGEGAIFDPMDEKSLFEQAAMFVHEIAHRTTLENSIDASADWLHASGWRNNPKSSMSFRPGVWLSAYAKSNPLEDFAETFALYRVRPSALRSQSNARYEFMRTRVFGGFEYTQELCEGVRSL